VVHVCDDWIEIVDDSNRSFPMLTHSNDTKLTNHLNSHFVVVKLHLNNESIVLNNVENHRRLTMLLMDNQL